MMNGLNTIRFSGMRWVVGVFLCFAPTVCFGQAVWETAELPGCDDCLVTNLHFETSQDGWATGRSKQDLYYRFQTNDAGKTWTARFIDLEAHRILAEAQFLNALGGWTIADKSAFWFDRLTQTTTLRVNGHNPGENNDVDAPVRFYQTTDGGNSWQLREGKITEMVYFGNEAGKEANRKYLSQIRFITPDFGVIGGTLACWGCQPWLAWRGYIILVTRDGGETWKAQVFGDTFQEDRGDAASPDPMPILDIEFWGDQFGWIPVSGVKQSRLFRTSDGGRTWEITAFPGHNEAPGVFATHIQFVTPTIGWSWSPISGVMNGIVRTGDSGQSWRPVSGNHRGPYFMNPNEGWALGETRAVDNRGELSWRPDIFRTHDAGNTWQTEYESPLPEGFPFWENRPDTLKYDGMTRTLWAFGYKALIRRNGVVSRVHFREKLPTIWGILKRR